MPPETQLYRFDAPAGHTLHVGDDVYGPGAELELPVGQVDPRLTPIGEDDRGLSETVQDEVDSIEAAEEETEELETEPETDRDPEPKPESAEKPEEPSGFGNPRPARAKSAK